jgi:hypothetical protein
LPDIPVCFRSDFATGEDVEIDDVCGSQRLRGKAYKDAVTIAQLGARPAQRVPIWLEPSQICNKVNSRVLCPLAYELRLAQIVVRTPRAVGDSRPLAEGLSKD